MKKKRNRASETCDTSSNAPIYTQWSPRSRGDKGKKRVFEEIMVKTNPKYGVNHQSTHARSSTKFVWDNLKDIQTRHILTICGKKKKES